tara:strand:- start:340 stop:1176 length:837 start_codon:yes stop_codon:yes gene_type:complete
MTTTTFLVILFAAILHAVWNALVKGGSDKLLQMAAVSAGHIPFAIVALYYVPPLNFTCWPNLLLGCIFHFGYQIFLVESYKKGDLSQVYPIARASAPLMVTIITFLFLGEKFGLPELLAIFLIIAGLLSTVGVRIQHVPKNAAISALITGCFIASYSLVDGYGGRIGESPVAYYCWLSIINGIGMIIYCRFVSPGTASKIIGSAKWIFLGGGFASFLAYSLVMWAFFNAPIAIVMAIRETSIIFAFIIGIIFLKEKLTTAKLLGTLITVSGIIVLRTL